uniref:(California timema) hypothetical protein n=1 Tax=Timema californicum TaxID=61474 RepID=A0A7R9JJL0_TIMCA|nr:unnamed protein product [Timema californicum]
MGKFRKEFRRTFGFWWCREHRYTRRDTLTPHSSTYICRFTTGMFLGILPPQKHLHLQVYYRWEYFHCKNRNDSSERSNVRCPRDRCRLTIRHA